MSLAEKGDVSEIDPALFVGHLYRNKATGTLKFEEAPVQRAVYFRDGRVLFSSSNAPEDQLGAILVAAGKITQTAFDTLLAELQPKQSIAAALSQGGHVSQRDIGDAARRKVEQIVGACCAQTTGRYEFEDGVLPRGALDLKLTTERVLVSAFSVLEPSGFLIRILKSPLAVLAPGDVEMTDPDLIAVREALDGVSPLTEVSGKVGLSQAATDTRAAVLVVLGGATVVTSQIEEMALPDTGETTPIMELGFEAEPIEAPSLDAEPGEARTIAFGQAPEAGGANFGSDATLVMSSSESDAFAPSSESTLIMENDFSLPPPATPDESGSIKGGALKRERTSTADLDAIKELIGSDPSDLSSPVLPAPSPKKWASALSASDPGEGLLHNPTVRRVGAFALVAVLGGAAWLFYSQQMQPPPRTATAIPVATPTPAPPGGGIIPFEPPPSATTAAAGGSPAATTSTAPATAPATAATPTTPPASTTPAAPAATAAAPKPVTTQTPTAATPQPAAAAIPDQGSAHEALKAGRLAEAEAAFRKVAQSRRAEFSIQLVVACSPDTIGKAVLNDPSPELYVLPTVFSGKPCHRLMRGFYKTSAEATAAVSGLPPYYVAEGARPRAVAVKTVLN